MVWGQEIFDFIGEHLHLVERHSLRTYYLAHEQKLAGLDWRCQVLNRCLTGKALEVARLKADASFGSEKDRVAAFVAAGHGCRATYFNHAKKPKAPGGAPAIQLTQVSAPERPVPQQPAPEQPAPDIFEILRRRNRKLGEG